MMSDVSTVVVDGHSLGASWDRVRLSAPLVHCITNYVTVNDCANALLACGASPIMSDEPDDVEDITSICSGLVVNIGTLNKQSIEAMRRAGARATELGHAIVLDPVGAGASTLRTETAGELLDSLSVSVVRANMSEAKALIGAAATTRGVDVDPEDVVTEDSLRECAVFAREFARRAKTLIAITGAIDLVADEDAVYAVRNGVPSMGGITGTGCMLTCLVAAAVAANPENELAAVVSAVAGMGLAGQMAFARMTERDGNATMRTYILDALCHMSGEMLERGSLVERII